MARLTDETAFPATKSTLSRILRVYGIEDFDFSHMTTGIINTTILITAREKKYILRIYQYNRKQVPEIEEEILFQNFLRSHGIPTATVFLTREGKNIYEAEVNGKKWQIILMEYMSGHTGSSYTHRLLKELSYLQANMHLLGMEYAEKKHARGKKLDFLHNGYAEKVMAILGMDSVKQQYLQEVKNFEVHFPKDIPYGYNHLDIDLEGNVLVKDDHITAVLDFDDLIFSPIVVCLGYTLWHILFTTNDFEKVEEYVQLYQEKRKLTSEEKEVLIAVMQFRNFTLGCLYLELRKDKDDFQKILAVGKKLDAHTTEAWQ